MGFIKDNANTIEVYLTELGKEKFFNGGLKDAVVYFSLSDGGSNYLPFIPSKHEILEFDILNLYSVGDVVKYNNNYYRKVSLNQDDPEVEYYPDNELYWRKVYIFDATDISIQPIPVLNHANTYRTSIDNDSGEFLSDVFTQTSLRGKISDNVYQRRGLYGTKNNTQKEYLLYEPDLGSESTLGVLTYILNE